jgi:hypothetical protein
MNQEAPDTVITAESTHWLDTRVGDVFAPHVRVQLAWTDIEAAVRRGAVDPAQAHALWADWADPGNPRRVHRHPGSDVDRGPLDKPRFSMAHVLYYFGGLLAMGAMSLFMTWGWAAFGPWGSAVLTALYLWAALRVATHLLRRELNVPAGVLATLAVTLVPLLVWSVQVGLGWWPDGGASSFRAFHTQINWRWIMLELATLAAAVVMLRNYRLPFMVMPVAVVLWYASMDWAHLLMQNNGFDWKLVRDFSAVFGLGTLALAVWVDLRTRVAAHPVDRQDFAFWLYIFGTLMFWCGLSLRDSSSEWGKAGYAAINVVMVFWGVAINRRVFTVFGGLGVMVYLGYLSSRVFQDSLGFMFALTLLGLGLVAVGVWWQRHERELHTRLAQWLPGGLQPLAVEKEA